MAEGGSGARVVAFCSSFDFSLSCLIKALCYGSCFDRTAHLDRSM